MKVIAVSDLHGRFPILPEGDLLIVAGDLTAMHSIEEMEMFVRWVNGLKYEKIIVIGGNHDECLQSDGDKLFKWAPKVEYLLDSSTEFRGLKIYGSPWTAAFPGMNKRCMAFTCATEMHLAEKFENIPNNLDILITHSPPYRILDTVETDYNSHCGSRSLLHEIEKKRPRYHIFGHIHEHGGKELLLKSNMETPASNIWCYNVSYLDQNYEPFGKVLELEIL